MTKEEIAAHSRVRAYGLAASWEERAFGEGVRARIRYAFQPLLQATSECRGAL